MSTFFHSAAMTLLSRTLQTLLSKYLSDVDVEGVALPSLYSSDGSSGGWGVRLSNVKLREGAMLMELPGKPKKKKAPKQKKKTNANASVASDGQDKSKEAQDTPTATATAAPTTDSTESLTMNNNEEVEVAEQQTVQTVAESDAETMASQTTTSANTTSSSWFYWGSRSKKETKPAVVEQKDSSGPVPLVEADPASENGTKENGTTKDSDPSRKGVVEVVYDAETKTEEIEVNDEDLLGKLDDDNDDDDDSEDDEDDDDEAPMILRLGAGGTIGILDVRLVNNAVHVMVEDAFLTIEAVQLEPDEGEDGTDKDAKEKKKVQKKVLDPKSVGDRVLKENAIARALSAIPNLFLRDIQVRLIVRDEVVRASSNKEESAPESSSNTDSNGDVVVDLGIEFLSVTDGEDFMANFRGEDESSDGDDSAADDSDTDDDDVGPRMNVLSGFDSPYNQNEFFAKRIRTGRGPEGGLTIRIYPSGELGNGIEAVNPKPLWARHSWVSSTQYCVLRLSGFDLLARIYFGEKTGDVAESSEWYVDEYEEYNVDSMLFGGVDYIAPGPKPPLPPMARRGATTVTDGEEIVWDHPGVSTYIADANGIQSCTLNSSFYKVARGLMPTMCDKDHLPCEWCSSCWAGAPGIAKDHEKDGATPMPGLVLNISTRDPIEINIDRPSLEVIGLLVGLFTKKATTPDSLALDEQSKQTKSEAAGDMDTSETSKSRDELGLSQRSVASTAAISKSASNASKKITTQNSLLAMISRAPVLKEEDEEDPEDCFPSYMQPEKIQILGLHLSEIKLRIHVMRADDAFDYGLSFCYWEVLAKCVTVDQQQMKAPEKELQDIRIDVGYLKAIEYKGVERKQLVSIGMKQRVVEFDEVTVETMRTLEENNLRSPWPSTAAALLEMQPPLETLAYEARDRHALQLRYISVNSPGLDYDTTRTHANMRVGIASLDAPWAIRTTVRTILDQARESVLGPQPIVNEPGTPEVPEQQSDSLMKYKMQIDGGHMRLDPVMDVRLPLTKFFGERSSDTGLSFETLLDRVSLRYGQHAPADSLHQRGLSLEQLAELSENVRLRILLFIKDLKPLEVALGVKPESNSFLRCRAVNKGIVRMAKKVGKSLQSRTNGSAEKPTTRRQELVTELLRMDDDSMEELFTMYTRSQKAKKRANTAEY
jgi:hypothetical protein